MRVQLVDDAFETFLKNETGQPWRLGAAPDGASDMAIYGIIYRITAGLGIGSLDQPEERREVQYQLTIVAKHHREVSWLSDRVNDRMVGRKAGGGYKVDLPVAGVAVEDRWVVSLGTIIPSGEDRFTINDNYRMRVANA